MSDLKTLFHQPELLSVDEQRALARKIWVQRKMPLLMCGVGAGAMALADTLRYKQVFGHKLAVAAVLGFSLGGYAANRLDGTWIAPKMEEEILQAYDQRQAQKFFTVSGFASGWTSFSHIDFETKREVY